MCVSKKSWELRRITGSESAYIFLPFLPLSGLWLAAFQLTQAQIRTRRGGQGLEALWHFHRALWWTTSTIVKIDWVFPGVCSLFWMLVSNEHVLNISLNWIISRRPAIDKIPNTSTPSGLADSDAAEAHHKEQEKHRDSSWLAWPDPTWGKGWKQWQPIGIVGMGMGGNLRSSDVHTHSVRFENMVLECIRMVLVFYPYSIVYNVYIPTIWAFSSIMAQTLVLVDRLDADTGVAGVVWEVSQRRETEVHQAWCQQHRGEAVGDIRTNDSGMVWMKCGSWRENSLGKGLYFGEIWWYL